MDDFDYGPRSIFNVKNKYSPDPTYESRPMGQTTLEAAAGIKDPDSGLSAGSAGSAGSDAAEAGGDAALAASNPWVKGGLAAMKVLSAGLERKRKEREMEYQSVVDKLRAQSQAVGNAQQFASRISY